MCAQRFYQFVVAHARVILPGRTAVFRQIGIPEFFVQIGNQIFPFFFRAFAAVFFHVPGQFFIEQTVEIDKFHYFTFIIVRRV